jgi:hypothetical protein
LGWGIIPGMRGRWRSEGSHVPGAEAPLFKLGLDVRAKARTYLRGESNGKSRDKYRSNGKARTSTNAGVLRFAQNDKTLGKRQDLGNGGKGNGGNGMAVMLRAVGLTKVYPAVAGKVRAGGEEDGARDEVVLFRGLDFAAAEG